MKILKIKLKNIHSLKGEHEVDFANGVLADAGLFVITGPTGSGKSTILDAITLALYNRIPRNGSGKISKNVIENEGLILTKNTTDCYSEVTYQVGDEIYRSTWSIRRTRNNTLDDRKQELINDSTGEIIVEGKEAVPAKNEEIIGLSYDQFVQSLILAQGQFSKLLLASKDDRNKLLEKITGSEIYRSIGMKVFERFTSTKKSVDDQKLKMGEITLLTEEQEVELHQFISDKEPKRLNLKAEQDIAKVLLEVKKQLQKLTKENLANLAEWERCNLDLKQNQAEIIMLNRHNELVPFQNDYRTIQLLEKSVNDLQTRLHFLNSRELTLKESQASLLVTTSKLLNTNILEENFVIELNVFKQQILAFKSKEIELNQQVETFNKQLTEALKRLAKENISIEKSNQNKEFILGEITKINTFSELLNNPNSEEISKQKYKLKNEIHLVNVLIKNKNIYNLYLNQKDKLQAEIKCISDSLSIFEAKQKTMDLRHKELIPLLESKRKEVEQLKTEQNLEEHRNQLVENEPCPLCGSLDHPFATKYEERLLDALKKQFKSLEVELKLIENEKMIVITSKKLGQESKASKEKEVETNSLEFQKIELEIRTGCKQLSWNLENEISIWEENRVKLDTKISDLERLESEYRVRAILTEIVENLDAREDVKVELSIKITERSKIYSGQDIEVEVSNHIKSWTENSTSFKAISEELVSKNTELSVLVRDFSLAKEKLMVDLKEKSVLSLEVYVQQLLSEKEAEAIRVKVSNLTVQNAKLEQESKRILTELAVNQVKDDLTKSEEQVRIDVKQLEDEIQLISESIGANRRQIETNNEAKSRLAVSFEILEKLTKDLDLWSTMNKLIGDSSGKRFSDFVQDLTLSQLITFGNQRLKSFSDRYLLAIPQRNESVSLQVIDTQMGNTQRSVNSLSGGETFKLSLALAFGLSDLAAKNVNIESLFIDEGFGTLDPESLDQAITILEEMQYKNNKSIGIISHVGELKDRIGAKIKLVRTGAGYSRIEVE